MLLVRVAACRSAASRTGEFRARRGVCPADRARSAVGGSPQSAGRRSSPRLVEGDRAMRGLTDQERAEIERDSVLPQLDARRLVDEQYLEGAIKEMYTEVAENPEGEFHFLTGRPLAEGLGYEAELLDRIPAEAIDSFAGVGHYFDLAA